MALLAHRFQRGAQGTINASHHHIPMSVIACAEKRKKGPCSISKLQFIIYNLRRLYIREGPPNPYWLSRTSRCLYHSSMNIVAVTGFIYCCSWKMAPHGYLVHVSRDRQERADYRGDQANDRHIKSRRQRGWGRTPNHTIFQM